MLESDNKQRQSGRGTRKLGEYLYSVGWWQDQGQMSNLEQGWKVKALGDTQGQELNQQEILIFQNKTMQHAQISEMLQVGETWVSALSTFSSLPLFFMWYYAWLLTVIQQHLLHLLSGLQGWSHNMFLWGLSDKVFTHQLKNWKVKQMKKLFSGNSLW